MMEAICSSETSVLTRTKRRYVPKDGIFIVTAVNTKNLKKSVQIYIFCSSVKFLRELDIDTHGQWILVNWGIKSLGPGRIVWINDLSNGMWT
jgi:hypothetical protein